MDESEGGITKYGLLSPRADGSRRGFTRGNFLMRVAPRTETDDVIAAPNGSDAFDLFLSPDQSTPAGAIGAPSMSPTVTD